MTWSTFTKYPYHWWAPFPHYRICKNH